MKAFLDKKPEEWGRFQSEFNQEINGIFRDLMLFEKENISSGKEEKVYKLKNFFIENFRDDFVKGEFLKWSFDKPYGYAGDYKIIEDIYLNTPKSHGFTRLFDNYFQMSAISIAVRNRKEDFKRIITNFIMQGQGRSMRIMDIASGPCHDVKELLSSENKHRSKFGRVSFDCFDGDHRSIGYAKEVLKSYRSQVNFTQLNIVKLALSKDVEREYPFKYDVIYSTGLFDYLDTRVATRLICNLKQLLNPGGILAISDVRDKYSNPSIYFMEWVADWSLVYRDDDDFRSLFVNSGFPKESLSIGYEQQGIMQYVIAAK